VDVAVDVVLLAVAGGDGDVLAESFVWTALVWVCCRWARRSRAAFLWFGAPKFADRIALTLVDVQGCWRAAWACCYLVTAVPLRHAVVKATLCRSAGSCAARCRKALSVWWEEVLRMPGLPTPSKYLGATTR
jgi:hypothetical protein